MKTFKTKILVSFALMFAASVIQSAVAQVSNYKAYTLFVYNFTKYIEWPEGAIKQEFVIGVYGNSPISEEFQKMATLKKAGDRVIRIVEVNEATLAGDVQILFLPEEKSLKIEAIVHALRGRSVLLVTEKQGLVSKGANISFLSDKNSVKFELNNNALSSQHLKVSKTLEALAFKGPS
jgi:hypothetical protein